MSSFESTLFAQTSESPELFNLSPVVLDTLRPQTDALSKLTVRGVNTASVVLDRYGFDNLFRFFCTADAYLNLSFLHE